MIYKNNSVVSGQSQQNISNRQTSFQEQFNRSYLASDYKTCRKMLLQLLDQNQTSIKLLDTTIFYSNIFNEVSPAQETLGKKVGIKRGWTNKLLTRLHEAGLLIRINRGIWQTCQYRLHPIFNVLEFRRYIKDILKQCAWLPKSMLLSCSIVTFSDIQLRNVFKNRQCTPIREDIFKYPTPPTIPTPKFGKGMELEEKSKEVFVSSKKNSESSMEILETIKKELNLTSEGAISLQHFRPGVLEDALFEFKSAKNVKNPYLWIFTKCKKISDEQSVKIDWRSYYRNREENNIDDKTPMFIVPTKQPTTTPNYGPAHGTDEFKMTRLRADLKRYQYLYGCNPTPKLETLIGEAKYKLKLFEAQQEGVGELENKNKDTVFVEPLKNEKFGDLDKEFDSSNANALEEIAMDYDLNFEQLFL